MGLSVHERSLEIANEAWLGLGDTSELKLTNPFSLRTVEDIENPHIFLLNLMRKAEYFGFTCQHLLNKTLAPFQMAILQELWNKPFPMLIGSRGAGKCVTGDSHIVVKNKICKIADLVDGSQPMAPKYYDDLMVVGENGYKKVAYAWNNGERPTKKINTRFGYMLEGVPEHQIRVVDKDKIVWKEMQDVKVGDFLVIDRNSEDIWHESENSLDDDVAYFFGLLTGDGGYTRKGAVSFTTDDDELAEAVSRVSMKLWGKRFSKLKAKYAHEIYGVSIVKELFEKYGFNSSVCGEKGFPASVLSSSRSAIASYVRGLMDTDGGIDKCDTIEYCSKSPGLVKTLQFVLSRFGIIGKRFSRYNKKYKTTYWYVSLTGKNIHRFAEQIGFGLTRKRKRLEAAITKKINANLDIIPKETIWEALMGLRNKWVKVRPPESHGNSYNRHIMSPCTLNAYGLTYEKLLVILTLTQELCDCDEWEALASVHHKNYYFDEVKSVEDGFANTYDVHVPDDHSYISNGIISHNTWILALYALLRALFQQGSKIVIVGAAFRQSKFLFENCEAIWYGAPILQDICSGNKRNGPKRDVDRCVFRIGDSEIVALPLGSGDKIRGQRASVIIVDEFSSVPLPIYETVVEPFSSVGMAPLLKVQNAAKIKALKKMGLWSEDEAALTGQGLLSNQSIISGTAYYNFNHFFSYWCRWKSIIESKGDQKKLEEIFKGEIPSSFSWKDYSIIRLPVELLPEGFMDEKNVSKSKATIHLSQFLLEYSACFANDSNGFYKRTLIESCVVGQIDKVIEHPSCGEVIFNAVLRGNPSRKYVIGIDPASEQDNFSVVVLELHPDHRRIVYCWTTTRKKHKAKLSKGLVEDHDFYSFVARKIRELMSLFPPARLCLDSQGGGIAVMEALQDPARLKTGESLVYEIIDDQNPKDTDSLPGEHLLEIVNFAKAEWVVSANHGMRKDFEDKKLLFPQFDSAILGLSIEEDKETGRVKTDTEGTEKLYDTLEDCILELEEAKDELAAIIHTQVGVSQRDHWSTPEVKLPGGKKGRLRKDRYSALLMANAGARQIQLTPARGQMLAYGGFARELSQRDKNSKFREQSSHVNPQWYVQEVGSGANYGAAVRRSK